MALNDCAFSGRLVRDPELRRTGSGIAVTSFTIAVERDIPGQDGKRETDYVDCVAWREKGEFVAKYFKKASPIIAKGRMQQRGWTDKNGNKRTSWELQVEAIYFSGSKQDSDSAGGQKSGQNSYGGQGGYSAPAGGYGGYSAGGSTYGGYSVPQNPASDFAMLDDDDGHLPF